MEANQAEMVGARRGRLSVRLRNLRPNVVLDACACRYLHGWQHPGMADRRTGEHAVSEALDRLRKAMLTEQVRVALRNGLTIAEVQAKYPTATKRFVEEQRAFLRQTEGVPDPRRVSVADEVVALSDQGLKPKTIAKRLGIHMSTVYRHRRNNG